MKAFSRLRRAPGGVAALVLLMSVALVPHAASAAPLGFCDGTGLPTVGEGATSQAEAHSEVFAPMFASRCPKGAGVSYLATGDSQGIRVITERLLPSSFGASNVAMTPAQKVIAEADLVKLRGRYSPVLQIPLYVDGVALLYNIPCAGPPVKFRSAVLSLIYSGGITSWSDPALVADNPQLASCRESVVLTKRSDVAGSTLVLKDYLAKRNPQWQAFKLPGFTEQWPTLSFACSGAGDAGMVNCIRSQPGAIGYVQLGTALASGLKVGLVENLSGTFVTPSPATCSAAAQSAVVPPGVQSVDVGGFYRTRAVPATMGDWSTVSITDPVNGSGSTASYPICTFSYVIVFYASANAYGFTLPGGVLRNTIDYLWVALESPTQAGLTALGLAPLPANILAASREGVLSMISVL
jgi:ABC-type phosphate transport system substrate-binding protein